MLARFCKIWRGILFVNFNIHLRDEPTYILKNRGTMYIVCIVVVVVVAPATHTL